MYTLDWAPMGAFFGTRIISCVVFSVHITKRVRPTRTHISERGYLGAGHSNTC